MADRGVPALGGEPRGWEHTVVNAFLATDYMAEIRVMGWQGWELVAAVPFNDGHGIRFYFKRPTRRVGEEGGR